MPGGPVIIIIDPDGDQQVVSNYSDAETAEKLRAAADALECGAIQCSAHEDDRS